MYVCISVDVPVCVRLHVCSCYLHFDTQIKNMCVDLRTKMSSKGK